MSIFPKRAAPGETVTIHWNFNTANLTDFHVVPWVRIGVISPRGTVTMLFEEHVLGLPDAPEDTKTEKPPLRYLNKNVPLLLLANYLSGKHTKEKLVEILQNIQSGRHYYFTYQVPKDAPLGKYQLLSEIHINGEVRYSKTAADDFFFVEKVSLKQFIETNGRKAAIIYNHSPEDTPIKIVGCESLEEAKMRTSIRVFDIPPLKETRVSLTASINFLLYNEERQVVPLQIGSPNFLLRNQQIITLKKANGSTYLFKEKDEAYELTPPTNAIWQKADGLLRQEALTFEERIQLEEMVAEGLVDIISFEE